MPDLSSIAAPYPPGEHKGRRQIARALGSPFPPQLVARDFLKTRGKVSVEVRLQRGGRSPLALYWATPAAKGFAAQRRQLQPARYGEGFQTYRFGLDLGEEALDALRLDPAQEPGKVLIDAIRLNQSRTPGEGKAQRLWEFWPGSITTSAGEVPPVVEAE